MENRIAYLLEPGEPMQGSRYKYFELLKKCGFDVSLCRNTPDGISWIKKNKPLITVIIGDGTGTYKICQKKDIPYILIESDIMTLRKHKKSKRADLLSREKRMIHGAAKIIFTSEDHQKHICTKYGYPVEKTIVVYLRPSAKDLCFEPLPKLPGKNLVYVGGIVPWSDRRKKRGHRAYYKYFESFIKVGWKVYIYTSRNYKVTSEYISIGCIDCGKIPQGQLYREISQYTAGFQSYNRRDAPVSSFNYCMMCRPNKLWEYLAAGIPTIGFNGGNGTGIYNGKWGVTLPNLKEKTIMKIDLPVITKEMRQGQVIDVDAEKMKRFIFK